ncbi:MAG: hypothetical protein ATN35_03970 [Epulopiscium sp. Nele67-Bin004]|nr:MAG: hypothetical protein ATN35_03970 [Epulopiscium sp. Nele67-Bin004]
MKLMNKLAIALSTVMVFGAIPAVTMAASNAIIDMPNIIIGSTLGYDKDFEGNIILDSVDEIKALNIFVETTLQYKEEQFLIKGTDVSFDDLLYPSIEGTTTTSHLETVEVERLDDTTLRVRVLNIDEDKMFAVPVYLEVTGSNPKLDIIGNGGISSQTINISKNSISHENIKIAFGEQKNIPIEGDGTLGEIIIEEVIVGALNETTQVVIDLATNSGLIFDLAVGNQIEFTGKEGFAGLRQFAEVTYVSPNNQQIILEVPALNDNGIKGEISIKNLPVRAENRKAGVLCSEVELLVAINDISSRGVVSQVTEYEVYLGLESPRNLVVTAGGASNTVQFSLNETVAGSLDNNLDIFFTVSGADIINFEDKVIDGVHFSASKNNHGEIYEIVAEMTRDFDKSIANEIVVELELLSGVNETGTIEILAESRGFKQDLLLELGKIKNTLNVSSINAQLQAGYRGQVGGQIVISETEKDVLEKDGQIIVEIASASANDIRIENVKVEGTNGLVVESKIVGDYIVIDVIRESAAAGNIIISDIEFTVGQNAPLGNYSVNIGGNSISNKNTGLAFNATDFTDAMKDVIVVENFASVVRETYVAPQIVQTPQPEIKEVVVEEVQEVVETVTQPTVITVANTYMTDAGNVMVGVRDIVTALGLPSDALSFENKQITISTGNTNIVLEIGSNIMNINGIDVVMNENVVSIEGRTCVSARFLAIALGLDMQVNNGAIEFII